MSKNIFTGRHNIYEDKKPSVLIMVVVFAAIWAIIYVVSTMF